MQEYKHHTTFLLEGRCLEETARPWDREAAGIWGKRLPEFVRAPALWLVSDLYGRVAAHLITEHGWAPGCHHTSNYKDVLFSVT